MNHSWMTLRAAAARTGLSATTLRRYIKSGRLRARLIPGRYGPEYVVDDEGLRGAELLGPATPLAEAIPLRPASRFPVSSSARPVGDEFGPEGLDLPAAADDSAAPADLLDADLSALRDVVPGLLYRELLMKHEHLLVQYGMMRVSGQQLLEVRREAERRADEARAAAAELETIRDRHAREIGALKSRLRQAELEIAARDDDALRLRADIRRLEIALRNAVKSNVIDEEFARLVRRRALETGGPANGSTAPLSPTSPPLSVPAGQPGVPGPAGRAGHNPDN